MGILTSCGGRDWTQDHPWGADAEEDHPNVLPWLGRVGLGLLYVWAGCPPEVSILSALLASTPTCAGWRGQAVARFAKRPGWFKPRPDSIPPRVIGSTKANK